MTVNIIRLTEIDKFIKTQATGTPEVFSSKIGISKATLFRYLHFMKKKGAPIEYNYYKKTYFYKIKGNVHIGFVPESL